MSASFTRSNKVDRRSPHGKVVLSLLAGLSRMAHVSGQRSRQSEQGLSIIECLVAIVVIAITVVAITPPIMLATASRIQSRKIEKANQVAQGEIDRVKLLVERGTYTKNELPDDAGTNTISTVGVASGAPSSSDPFYILSKQAATTCTNTYLPSPSTAPVAFNKLVSVDVDGDCKADYVMQVFRTTGYYPDLSATAPYSFVVGVRVYAYYPGQPFPTLDTTKASARMGTGPLDSAGGKRRPMAVLYSSMARNDSSKSLGQLCAQSQNGVSCKF